MTSGIGSISFVGFPVFEFFYGDEGLSYGVILSLGGTFVVCNSIGIGTGFFFAEQTKSLQQIMKEIFYFPPFIAMLLAVILLFFGYEHHPVVKKILEKLSSPFSVLALFAVGYQIQTNDFLNYKKLFLFGQFYKLILAPLLIYLVFYFTGNQDSLIAQICILGAGIGSMNTISIIAAELNLQPKLSFLMSGFGIPISIVTLLIIYFLIH